MPSNPTSPRIDSDTAVIANGAALSGAVNLGGRVLVGILMPATWTAAGLDGVTYADVFDAEDVEVGIDAAASRFITLNPSTFAGIRFAKIRSGTTGSPVNQGGARVVTLALREVD